MSKRLIKARQDSKRLKQLVWAVETLQQHLSPDRTTITNPAALKLLLLALPFKREKLNGQWYIMTDGRLIYGIRYFYPEAYRSNREAIEKESGGGAWLEWVNVEEAARVIRELRKPGVIDCPRSILPSRKDD